MNSSFPRQIHQPIDCPYCGANIGGLLTLQNDEPIPATESPVAVESVADLSEAAAAVESLQRRLTTLAAKKAP